MPRSGKLSVLNLLTGQKSGFSPRRGDSLHRFTSDLAEPTGTWVRLAVQNFTSIGLWECECGPQNIKNFHFLVKSRFAGANPLTNFKTFRDFICLTILHKYFKFDMIRFTGYGVIAEKPRVGQLGRIFPCTLLEKLCVGSKKWMTPFWSFQRALSFRNV